MPRKGLGDGPLRPRGWAPSTACPCCGQPFPARDFIVDESYRIVIRHGKGVALPPSQFAILRALYKKKRALTIYEIMAEVYRGAASPNSAAQSVNVMIRCLNVKLMHVGLRVSASHPGRDAFWRINESTKV
jgi:DNA-binding response OmpR family regulator